MFSILKYYCDYYYYIVLYIGSRDGPNICMFFHYSHMLILKTNICIRGY